MQYTDDASGAVVRQGKTGFQKVAQEGPNPAPLAKHQQNLSSMGGVRMTPRIGRIQEQ